MSERIDLLKLEVFIAKDRPKEALEFFNGHQKLLKNHGIKGLKSAGLSWLNNPSVVLMALYSGEKIIGGSRIHAYNDEHTYPFMNAIAQHDSDLLCIEERMKGHLHGEWCGLWVSRDFKGIGLRDMLTRMALTTGHMLKLDYLYGICPRHTLDPFRSIGFHFITHEDSVIQFSYPSPEFMSYVIRCEVADMQYTFKSEKLIVESWINDPLQKIECSGLLGECMIQMNGFENIKHLQLHQSSTKSESPDPLSQHPVSNKKRAN